MIDSNIVEIFAYAIVAGLGLRLGWDTIPMLILCVYAGITRRDLYNDSKELQNITKAIKDLKR